MARILVVDDSMFMRQVLRNILTKAGHEVSEAESGEKAVEAVQRSSPDLLTLDLVMPGMGGMEALRRIRKARADQRVLVVSAVGQSAEVAEAVSLGAVDYIVKPFDETTVVKTVAAVLK